MRLSGRRKLSLIGTIISSFVMISTAAVATFAWFQASANATVTASSSSTTITTNKPDDYTFYGYNGNIGSHTPNGTFSNDFTALTTSSLVNSYTNFTNMVPGQRYVFAIGIEAASSVNLTLTSFISNNATKQNILDAASALQKRFVSGQSYEVNIGYAMDIFVNEYTPTNGAKPTGYTTFVTSDSGCKGNAVAGTALANGATASKGVKYYTRAESGAGAGPLNDGTYAYTYYGTGPFTADAANKYYPLTSQVADKFNYNVSTSADRTLLDSGSNANQVISQNIVFYNNASLTSTNDLYIVWSVVFSDVKEVLYKEVDSSGGDVSEEPSTGHRYFAQSNTGTSNCFGGLKFALPSFTLTIG